MARKLPPKDVVIIGMGWTGSILANELTDAGLDVVAIERGPWRDTATDFPISYMQDELRYRIQHELFVQPAQAAVTFRNKITETAQACIGMQKLGASCRPTSRSRHILRNDTARISCRKT